MSKATEKYILGCDVDNTLVPTDGGQQVKGWRQVGLIALETLETIALTQPEIVGFGSVTGRTMESQLVRAQEVAEFSSAMDAMSFSVTSVGTVLHRRQESGLVLDTSWPSSVGGYRAAQIHHAMRGMRCVTLQESAAQGEHKVSYNVAENNMDHGAFVAKMHQRLANCGIEAEVIFSGGEYLDFLPKGVHKGSALQYVAASYERQYGQRPTTIAAGDSMNDVQLLAAADMAIVPANADDSLRSWAEQTIPDKTYFAKQPFAAGILDALAYRDIIG